MKRRAEKGSREPSIQARPKPPPIYVTEVQNISLMLQLLEQLAKEQ
jgi:hypothetical protein